MSSLESQWPLTTIGAEFDIQQGKSLSPAARRGNRPRPFLRTSNVFWGRVDLSSVDQMDFTEDEFLRLSLNDGDLLVCEGGDIGRSAVYRGPSGHYAYQNHLHRLRAKNDEMVPDFVVQWLRAAFTQLGLYEGVGNKTTIPNLSRGRLAQLAIPKPKPEDQQRIVRLLDSVQRSIENAAAQSRELSALKAATMAKLFREGLRGEPLQQTEIGEIPKSWAVRPIGDVITQAQYGLSIRGEREGRYPILRMNCQKDGRVLFENLQFVSLQEQEAATYLLADGDILFNRTNSIDLVGRTAIFQGERKAVFASYLIRLKTPGQVLNSGFLNHYLNRGDVQASLKSLATKGVSQANISASKLKGFPVPVPPDTKEQSNIVAVIDKIDAKKTATEARIAGLKALFSSTLHQLMTCAIRVNDLDLSEVVHA